MEIIPAIIAKSFEELKEKVKLVEPYVNWVQLDVMDGKFSPEKTWPYTDVIPAEAGIHKYNIGNLPEKLQTNLNLEVHLMVEDAGSEMERWLDSGVKRILVHYEALEKSKIKMEQVRCKQQQKSKVLVKIKNLLEKCDAHGMELGIVLNLKTPIDVLDDMRLAISDLQVIQLMSIAQIGYHGHPFDEKVIHKAESLKQKYPNVRIAIDGGVNEQVVKKMAKVGVGNFVAGSAIFNSKNIKETIEELKSIIKD